MINEEEKRWLRRSSQDRLSARSISKIVLSGRSPHNGCKISGEGEAPSQSGASCRRARHTAALRYVRLISQLGVYNAEPSSIGRSRRDERRDRKAKADCKDRDMTFVSDSEDAGEEKHDHSLNDRLRCRAARPNERGMGPTFS